MIHTLLVSYVMNYDIKYTNVTEEKGVEHLQSFFARTTANPYKELGSESPNLSLTLVSLHSIPSAPI